MVLKINKICSCCQYWNLEQGHMYGWCRKHMMFTWGEYYCSHFLYAQLVIDLGIVV